MKETHAYRKADLKKLDEDNERMVAAVVKMFPIVKEERFLLLDLSLHLGIDTGVLKQRASEEWQRVLEIAPQTIKEVIETEHK